MALDGLGVLNGEAKLILVCGIATIVPLAPHSVNAKQASHCELRKFATRTARNLDKKSGLRMPSTWSARSMWLFAGAAQPSSVSSTATQTLGGRLARREFVVLFSSFWTQWFLAPFACALDSVPATYPSDLIFHRG